jgi:hypothetical protein
MKRIILVLALSLLAYSPRALTSPGTVRPLARSFAYGDYSIQILRSRLHGCDLAVQLEAVRNGLPVFGPDKVFLFHNLPSGPLEPAIGEAVRVSAAAAFGPVTLTVFSDSGDPGTTSVDGSVGTNDDSTSYSDAHDLPGGSTCVDSACGVVTENSGIWLQSDSCSAQHFSVIRFLTNFDTSPLKSEAVITSATVSYEPSLVSVNTHADFIRVVTNSNATANTIVLADFTSFGTTGQASDVNVSSLTVNSYTDFALNSTGLGNISKTSITKFGIRNGMDINATAPTSDVGQCIPASQNSPGDGTIVFWYAREDGTTKCPKLVVNYSIPRLNGDMFFNSGK